MITEATLDMSMGDRVAIGKIFFSLCCVYS